MKHALFVTVLLAAMLSSSNGTASMAPERRSEQAIAMLPSEAVEIAAVDFCYAGSIIDPSTGESVDLFVICEEDGAEQNMDLA